MAPDGYTPTDYTPPMRIIVSRVQTYDTGLVRGFYTVTYEDRVYVNPVENPDPKKRVPFYRKLHEMALQSSRVPSRRASVQFRGPGVLRREMRAKAR